MTSNTKPGVQLSETPVLIFVGLCILCLTVSVGYYRITHSFLDIREVRTADDRVTGQGGMNDILKMMQSIKENPSDLTTLRALANAFMRMKGWDRAISFWDRVLAIQPSDGIALNQKGISLFQKQDYRTAATTFEKLLEIQPDNVYALFNLGVLYRDFLGNVSLGEKYLRKILEFKPGDKDVLRAVEKELGSGSTQQDTKQGQKD